MATLYEYYYNGDAAAEVYGVYFEAQTFTPEIGHKITSVKLFLYRVGLPGTVTVEITPTNGNGHPTGPVLCSGTTDGNTLDTAVYEWREITLGSGYDLNVDTKYAIILKALDGDASNKVGWRRDATDPTYTRGNREEGDGEGGWISRPSDFLFEDWGDPLPNYLDKTGNIANKMLAAGLI